MITRTAAILLGALILPAGCGKPPKQLPVDMQRPASISLVNVHDNDVLSGEFRIDVATRDSYQYGDVTLLVDGKMEGVGGGSTLTPDGSRPVPFFLRTNDYSNGTHTLTVQDNVGKKSSRTVTFRNEIAKIDVTPLFDTAPGVKDAPAVCTISGTLTSVQSWTVTVQTSDDPPVPVRTFSGKSANIHVTWDGKSVPGHTVKNEPYENTSYEVVLSCGKQTTIRHVIKNFR